MKNQNTCGAMIKQIHDEMRKMANNNLRPYGITLPQLTILMILANSENHQLSLKNLEQIFHVAQSTLVGLVSRLEQKKLVETFGDSTDKRVKIVRITTDGITQCKEAEQYIAQTDTYILSSLTEAERHTLLMLLQKIRDSIC